MFQTPRPGIFAPVFKVNVRPKDIFVCGLMVILQIEVLDGTGVEEVF